MGIADLFDGDNNFHVMVLQHEVYSQAQWTIVLPCQEYMAFACRLFGDIREEEMGVNVEQFDHRTLQRAHDILAAVWRFKFRANLLQLEFPFNRVISPKGNLVSQCMWQKELMELGDIYAREPDYSGLTPNSLEILKIHGERIGASQPIIIGKPIDAKNRVRLAAIDLDHIRHWLDWLNVEVQSWKHDPHLVRYVMKILTNQNQPEGYKAENELTLALISRFDEVPWHKKRG
jgi:hypothetical protein